MLEENNSLPPLQKIHPAEIGFDIDGVVANTADAFIRIARTDYGLHSFDLEDITEFEVENCLDVEPAIIEEIFAKLLAEPLAYKLQPMDHAVEVLTAFAMTGPLNFVTARPDREPIARWLEQILGPTVFSNCQLVAMGEHDQKAAHIKNMGLRYFVDDRAETCIMLKEMGITPFVFNQPWNRHKHTLHAVANWRDIRELCFG